VEEENKENMQKLIFDPRAFGFVVSQERNDSVLACGPLFGRPIMCFYTAKIWECSTQNECCVNVPLNSNEMK